MALAPVVVLSTKARSSPARRGTHHGIGSRTQPRLAAGRAPDDDLGQLPQQIALGFCSIVIAYLRAGPRARAAASRPTVP